jgi:phage-related protein
MSFREIIFFTKDAIRFYQVQPPKVQRKIDFVFDLVRNIDVVPIQYFKYLKGTNGIFEIKVVTHLYSLRFLCFFSNQKLIIVTNTFIKKSQKTPKKEIQIAERIKKEYESNEFSARSI